MGLIPLTSEERQEAVSKATAARARRAEVKAALKAGSLSLDKLFRQAEEDEALARLKVTELLESFHGIGPVRSLAILDQLGIAPSRRLRGLGVHQRQALIDFLEAH
ncbi:integration host factor, actinobacterial type [Sinomonas sp. ASV322]|uniref:integration host factor, actinobacterial type n=1 Tax=Sinomonas sp. ASV322 TaxID=3041920 RepID=UPI0027DC56D3|nr:integration host factor, actinobacterial type [Sinomonas sp. ASV322]MDQ4501128.1 integration host factor, actinobacterial type [Sinomonas sp. ASV322]